MPQRWFRTKPSRHRSVQLVHDYLLASARQAPDKVALICGQARATFRALDEASDRLAVAFMGMGLQKGDRVALMMDSSVELVASIFGVLKAGGVFVVLHPTTKPGKLGYVLDDCGVRILVASPTARRLVRMAIGGAASLMGVVWAGGTDAVEDDDTYEAIQQGPHVVPPTPRLIDQDLCTIIYTSGSTGDPKGVMLTHHNMTNTAWAISTYLENVADDVVQCALPLSFDYGLYQVITGARVGFTVVLERSFAYPYRVLERMAELRVTGFPGVPTMFATILQMRELPALNLSRVRYLSNTAASLPPAYIPRLQALFSEARVFSMYGLTECTRVAYLSPDRLPDKPDSIGKAMPNCEAYVVDVHGDRVRPGVVGELVVRGSNVMRGYWGKPDRTAQRLVDGEIPGEKVLKTGDLFRTDDEGFLYFVGRKDDIFKCKGEKISPKEIENVLHAHPGIAEAAVLGVPDPIEGHAIKALIVAKEGVALDPADVRHHCRSNLESYMVPKYVELCDALPKTTSGKVAKTQLNRA